MTQGATLDELVRYKFDLRKKVADLISELRKERENQNYNALFASNADNFQISSELAIVFDEQTYGYNQPYSGPRKFNKHYTPLAGDLKASGEEFECAVHLDEHSEVRCWIRNVEKKKSSFWLQLPTGKFYPDFIAMLNDGRMLVVEYKGGHLYESEKDKRTIGHAWADASDGKCLFCMPTNRDFVIIDNAIKR